MFVFCTAAFNNGIISPFYSERCRPKVYRVFTGVLFCSFWTRPFSLNPRSDSLVWNYTMPAYIIRVIMLL